MKSISTVSVKQNSNNNRRVLQNKQNTIKNSKYFSLLRQNNHEIFTTTHVTSSLLNFQCNTYSSTTKTTTTSTSNSLFSSCNDNKNHALKVLFLTDAHNFMSQRAMLNLRTRGHSVRIELALDEKQMIQAVQSYCPDLILCPFLTKRVPREIWENKEVHCFIVHPGIKGDRGISSIDWALKNNEKEWGVTILQAAEEIDAGDIWGTNNFKVERPITNTPITKASLYRKEVISAAMEGINDTLKKLHDGIPPEPLDYNDPNTKGRLQPKMKSEHRKVDWFEYNAQEIVNIIRFSDSLPGAPATIKGEHFRVFNAFVESNISELLKNSDVSIESLLPGDIIGHRSGALCIKAKDNTAVWISHVKPLKVDSENRFKIPATSAFSESFITSLPYLPKPPLELNEDEDPRSTFREVWIKREGSVCHIHFEFYNGAMSTQQCISLKQAIDHVVNNMEDIKVIVLRGGYDFFSNGINLNTIHHADNPSTESRRNIVAMDDLVRSIWSIKDKVTIAAFQGGAGAGGVMLGMAADLTWSHQQVLLNSHYKTMALYGSEYWTYFLPKRVGQETAELLTESMQPVGAQTAHELGMIDNVFGKNTEEFISKISEKVQQLENDGSLEKIISKKQKELDEETIQKIESHREHELRIMRENFEDEAYHRARRRFVLKETPPVTPLHLNNRLEFRKESNKIDTQLTREKTSRSTLMNGTNVAERILSKIKSSIPHFVDNYHRSPKLCIISVGDRRDSKLYIRKKLEKCQSIGIESEWLTFNSDDDVTKVEQSILEMNRDENVDGIMVQLPIPGDLGVHTQRIISAIDPSKDVDCLHPKNLGDLLLLNNESSSSDKLLSHSPSSTRLAPSLLDPSYQIPFAPCTVRGIIEILIHHDVKLGGKDVSIIGKSSIVGQPLSLCLLHHGASVSVYHIQSKNIKQGIQKADIVISCAGVPNLIDESWIKEGAVIVDVGINFVPRVKKKTENNNTKNTNNNNEQVQKPKKKSKKLVGDVNFESVRNKASLITPVPGGVGPVTVAMLMQNTVESFLRNVNSSTTQESKEKHFNMWKNNQKTTQ